jgi:hypothetical protein
MNCINCSKPLNETQYRKKRSLKSCPNCSTKNGKEHLFYPYPETFGTTPKRSSTTNPDGPQSYCQACRGEQEQPLQGILCSEIQKNQNVPLEFK